MVVVNSLEQWTKWNEILLNTDYIVSFPQNRKGSLKPPQTSCRSTMGVQSPSTLASVVYDPLQTVVNVIIYARGLYGETLVSNTKMII